MRPNFVGFRAAFGAHMWHIYIWRGVGGGTFSCSPRNDFQHTHTLTRHTYTHTCVRLLSVADTRNTTHESQQTLCDFCLRSDIYVANYVRRASEFMRVCSKRLRRRVIRRSFAYYIYTPDTPTTGRRIGCKFIQINAVRAEPHFASRVQQLS